MHWLGQPLGILDSAPAAACFLGKPFASRTLSANARRQGRLRLFVGALLLGAVGRISSLSREFPVARRRQTYFAGSNTERRIQSNPPASPIRPRARLSTDGDTDKRQ